MIFNSFTVANDYNSCREELEVNQGIEQGIH